MINAVGLANPGLDAVRREHLPWLAAHLPATRKLVNVVGFTVDEYPAVVAGLEEALARGSSAAVDGYELNVSCPNTRAGGLEFGADPASLAAVVSAARRETKRPVFVKLSPTLQRHRRIGAHRGRRRCRRDQRRQHDSRPVDRRRAAPSGARLWQRAA